MSPLLCEDLVDEYTSYCSTVNTNLSPPTHLATEVGKLFVAAHEYIPSDHLEEDEEENHEDLALAVGDFVRILEDKDDVGFYHAEHVQSGEQGWVPSNFLREPTEVELQGVSPEVPSPVAPESAVLPESDLLETVSTTTNEETAFFVAEFDYIPSDHKPEEEEEQAADELTLTAGDLLRSLSDLDEDGFYLAEHIGGPRGGQQGFAPSTFLRSATPAEVDAAQLEIKLADARKRRAASRSTSPQSGRMSNEVDLYRSSEGSTPSDEGKGSDHEVESDVGKFFVAEFTYIPKDHKIEGEEEHAEDELEMNAGDILRIVQDMGDDGFYVAELVGGLNTGRQGYAPSNYLREATEEETEEALQGMMMTHANRMPSVIYEEPEEEERGDAELQASSSRTSANPVAAQLDDTDVFDKEPEVTPSKSNVRISPEPLDDNPEPRERDASVDWAAGYRQTAAAKKPSPHSESETHELERSWIPPADAVAPESKRAEMDKKKHRVGRLSHELDLGDQSDLDRRDELARKHAAAEKAKTVARKRAEIQERDATRAQKQAEKERLAQLQRERIKREDEKRFGQKKGLPPRRLPTRQGTKDPVAEKRTAAMAAASAQRQAAKREALEKKAAEDAIAAKAKRQEERRQYLELKKVQEERAIAAEQARIEKEETESKEAAAKAAQAAEKSRAEKAKQKALFKEREADRAAQRAAKQKAQEDAVAAKKAKRLKEKAKQERLQRERKKRLDLFKLRKQAEEAAMAEWINGKLSEENGDENETDEPGEVVLDENHQDFGAGGSEIAESRNGGSIAKSTEGTFNFAQHETNVASGSDDVRALLCRDLNEDDESRLSHYAQRRKALEQEIEEAKQRRKKAEKMLQETLQDVESTSEARVDKAAAAADEKTRNLEVLQNSTSLEKASKRARREQIREKKKFVSDLERSVQKRHEEVISNLTYAEQRQKELRTTFSDAALKREKTEMGLYYGKNRKKFDVAELKQQHDGVPGKFEAVDPNNDSDIYRFDLAAEPDEVMFGASESPPSASVRKTNSISKSRRSFSKTTPTSTKNLAGVDHLESTKESAIEHRKDTYVVNSGNPNFSGPDMDPALPRVSTIGNRGDIYSVHSHDSTSTSPVDIDNASSTLTTRTDTYTLEVNSSATVNSDSDVSATESRISRRGDTFTVKSTATPTSSVSEPTSPIDGGESPSSSVQIDSTVSSVEPAETPPAKETDAERSARIQAAAKTEIEKAMARRKKKKKSK